MPVAPTKTQRHMDCAGKARKAGDDGAFEAPVLRPQGHMVCDPIKPNLSVSDQKTILPPCEHGIALKIRAATSKIVFFYG